MRRLAVVIALAFVVVILIAAPTAARPVALELDDLTLLPGPDATLDTTTGGVRVSVQPGGGVWQSAVVTNRGRQRFSVQFGGSDWLQPAAGSVLLEPGQSETVRFTVAPPSDTPAGESEVAFVAAVEGQPEIQKSMTVVVSVLAPVGPAPGAVVPSDAETTSDVSEPGAAPAKAGKSRTADLALFVLLVGGVGLLVTRTLIRPLSRLVKQRRQLHLAMTQISARVLSRLDARRIRRIVDASAAAGTIPQIPDRPTRADVRHAEYGLRIAEHRKRRRNADAAVREEARRLASTLWADRIRAARELAEQEASARLQRIETARAERASLAASLAEERRAADARDAERRRQIEEQRRTDAARRADERVELAERRRTEREAATLQTALAAPDAERREEAESRRSRFVRLRSLGARRTAIAWGPAYEAAQRAHATRTPELPGENGTIPPPELQDPVAFLDPLTGKVARPDRPIIPPLFDMPEIGVDDVDEVDVTALDVAELNRQLASAPSQGTRAASAQSRSKP